MLPFPSQFLCLLPVARRWTQYSGIIVSSIDENFTLLSEIQKQIELSGYVSFDILVAHPDLGADEDEDEDENSQQDIEEIEKEKSQVRAVMKLSFHDAHPSYSA